MKKIFFIILVLSINLGCIGQVNIAVGTWEITNCDCEEDSLRCKNLSVHSVLSGGPDDFTISFKHAPVIPDGCIAKNNAYTNNNYYDACLHCAHVHKFECIKTSGKDYEFDCTEYLIFKEGYLTKTPIYNDQLQSGITKRKAILSSNMYQINIGAYDRIKNYLGTDQLNHSSICSPELLLTVTKAGFDEMKIEEERKKQKELEKIEEQKRLKLEAEQKAKEESERLVKEEAERKIAEEERKKQEELARIEKEKKLKLEAEQKAKEEVERLAREEDERIKAKEERKKQEEALKAAEENRLKLETERLEREEADRKKVEAERIKQEDILRIAEESKLRLESEEKAKAENKLKELERLILENEIKQEFQNKQTEENNSTKKESITTDKKTVENTFQIKNKKAQFISKINKFNMDLSAHKSTIDDLAKKKKLKADEDNFYRTYSNCFATIQKAKSLSVETQAELDELINLTSEIETMIREINSMKKE